jgi:hypothetical protein
MVSASPPSDSSTRSAASTTTSRLSCGLGTLRRRGADRHGGSGATLAALPAVSSRSGMRNIVLDVNIVL